MNKVLIVLFVLLVVCGNKIVGIEGKGYAREAGGGAEETILPCADFVVNFCNFPQAWTVSKGSGVKVGILYRHVDRKDKPDWIKKVSKLAPGTRVETIDHAGFVNLSEKLAKFHIILLLEPVEKKEFGRMLQAIKYYTTKGTTILLPAYFGPMKKDFDYEPWQKFISNAANTGAVIVGAHGRAYQIGSLSYWKEVPVDVFALHNRINDFKYANHDALIDRNLEEAAYLTAGTAALLKGKNKNLLPREIKRIFKTRGRKILWTHMRIEWEKGKPRDYVKWFLSRDSINKFIKVRQKNNPKVLEVFSGSTLDAGLILGLSPMGDGEWSFNTLNAAPAQEIAVGKGVVVAILDHGFDKEELSLKNRVVKPGSVIPGAPVFSEASHGTWMAKDLVRIAPGVKIMPVRFCGNGIFGDADYYIKGIEYAVKNGADIISISHQAIAKEKQEAFDQAVKKASQKGVTLVYIHYYGDRKEVIETKPIEFAHYCQGREVVFVIGTNFIDDSSSNTWGLSQTAPIVSGVIAMMKEINPGLRPLAIKRILLKSVNQTPDGFPLLDALKAVTSVKRKK
jgi:hypothetical protein